jgi:hypothetical protein
MTRLLYIFVFILTLATAFTIEGYGQIGGNGPFSSPAPPSGNGTSNNGPYNGNGIGINPNDITPPPDPIDTPLDNGLILLLGVGILYGIKVARSKKAIGF